MKLCNKKASKPSYLGVFSTGKGISPVLLRNHSRVFPIVALVDIVYFGLAVIILHFLPTGYNPVTQAVSDYGVGRYAAIMSSAFFAIGIGTIALAISLLRFNKLGRLGRFGVLLLMVAGICFFAVGFFPTDLEGAAATTIGSLHTSLSAIVFLANILAALCLSWSFCLNESLRPFYKSSIILAIAEIVILIATKAFFDPSYGIRGVVERAFILSFYSWLLLTSIRIYRLNKNVKLSFHTT
jgi:hypothetical protein